VNHDLIAAGHPRLVFEYSSFLAAIQKHWSEQEERRRYPDLDARAWLIGQAVTAQAALELLSDRTQRIWPEFAEYDCRACHHNLTGAAPRTSAASSRDANGWLRWNEDFALMSKRAFALRTGPNDEEFAKAIEQLRTEMNKPMPDAGHAARLAHLAAG